MQGLTIIPENIYTIKGSGLQGSTTNQRRVGSNNGYETSMGIITKTLNKKRNPSNQSSKSGAS